ncbi:MBL fold metallo-hydrolase [Alkalicoccobacillus murimartini]|uniref:Glyoxylase-like metal-dependent hydrolase (Beta-lactamase superfamily II) n=1 Tax=Alkalicoccobacillus murimartini TaxID=171685 RepID=A0ABT9YHF1_9BACI|nr:MBL fold metallo-hydrolase [Alkalicoccobacillus murimartini]MDQ0207291.1 glyoxylase-like metal-dependent hydrolase (beta-lactamase superfamily II) [Alkalicoccobacillus murimartini]
MDQVSGNEPQPTLPISSAHDGFFQALTEDIYCFTDKIVNVYFIGNPNKPEEWLLIDCGISRTKDRILSILAESFGDAFPPKAIILTHGHFDHVGAAYELASHWSVNVYCHELELPFLNGLKDYPKPDPTVEGGLVAKLSGAFPYKAIDLSPFIQVLPEGQSIDGFPEWRWEHTPGHSPGQIALYREKDGALLSGDAIITVKQDSMYDVLTQSEHLQGPPRYFTTDWEAAKYSVERLSSLDPSYIAPGHGLPMFGEEFKHRLKHLTEHFDEEAIPDYGKYAEE